MGPYFFPGTGVSLGAGERINETLGGAGQCLCLLNYK